MAALTAELEVQATKVTLVVLEARQDQTLCHPRDQLTKGRVLHRADQVVDTMLLASH